MISREVLTTLYSEATLKDDSFWELGFNLNLIEFCNVFIDFFEKETLLVQDRSRFIQRTTACLNDLIEFKTKNPSLTTICDFFQFSLSSHLLINLVNSKLFTYAYDWISNSLDNIISTNPERNHNIDRIYSFIESQHPFIRQELINILGIWTYSLFYYSRITAGHIPTVKIFLEHFEDYFFSYPTRERMLYEYILSVCQGLAWAVTNNDDRFAKEMIRLLLKMEKDEKFPRDWKKDVIFQLSCVSSELTGQPQEVWAGQLLEKYSDLFKSHERIHVWINFTNNSPQKILNNIKVIKAAIDEYHDSISAMQADKSLIEYELSQIYLILFSTVVVLLKNGNAKEAEDLFAYNFQINNPFTGPLLHIIPNDPHGVVYVCDTKIITFSSQNIHELLRRILIQTNNFLQLTHTINGYPEYQPEGVPIERHGVPVEKEATPYYDMLVEYFDFNKLNAEIPVKDIRGCYFHNGTNIPIQPILTQTTGIGLPFNLSFQEPEVARKIKSVLLWEGDSMLSPHECEGLTMIFEKGGVDVSKLTFEKSSKEDFIAEYESDKYDCLIVSGHGTYNHYEPHFSKIHISDNIQLELSEINNLKNSWTNRRLLVLNICDGATTALHSSPLSLGIGSKLINAKQALFSHVWPINPRVAFIISWTIAVGIIKGMTYEELYAHAINQLLKGRESIFEELTPYLTEDLANSILNVEIDLANFTHWGSITYLQ